MDEENKTLKLPMYLSYDNRIFTVLAEITADEVFQDGKGYIMGEQIWIFKKTKPNDSKYPYFWYEHGKLLFGKIRDSIKDDFHISKLKDRSITETVYKISPDEVFYDESMLRDMYASTATYVPIIKDKDDFLKKLIKHAILDKKINVKRLQSRLDKSYKLSNLITSLNNDTKMSVPVFITWCDLLGLSFDIFIQDNGLDAVTPLPKTIHYDSIKDSFNKE